MPGMATSSPPITSCGSNAASSSPMMFAFRYISSKLAHRNIHLDFILDDSHNNINNNQGCVLIPLRPLSLSEQTLFTKIASSARAKFPDFRVQSRSLDRGALAPYSSPSGSGSGSGSAVPFSQDDPHAAATDSNKQSSPSPDPSSTRPRTKHEYIFEVVDPIHILHQSNIPHHVVFRADGLLVLSIDPSPSNDGEEGEEFILHSSSSWSSLNARGGIGEVGGEGGDMFDSPIYGFGLRDYFRNNPRLGQADGDVPTTRDNNPSHESEDDVVRRMRRTTRDNDNINPAVQGQRADRKEVARRPIPSFKGKEPSSSSSSSSSSVLKINNNNRAYPSSSSPSSSSSSSASSLLPAPLVTAPHHPHPHPHQQQQQQQQYHHYHHHHHHHRDTSSSSYSNNKIPFEFALSEYPLYRRDSGLGVYTNTTTTSTSTSTTAAAAAAAAAAAPAASSTAVAATEGYDLPSHLMDEEMESGGVDSSSTTMILGSEWEAFRRIGLGVGG